MRSLARSAFGLAFWTTTSALCAQVGSTLPRGTLTGLVVVKGTEHPVPYADVTIERVGSAFADADGRFQFRSAASH